MAKSSYVVTGMDRWLAAVGQPEKFKAQLAQNMRKATELNGKLAERYMRKAIQTTFNIVPNADLTINIKKSSRPLVDYGELFKGITSQVVDNFTVFVGVLKTDQEKFNIAKIVHEGTVLPVTPAMRGMFLFLYKASMGEMDPAKLTGRAAALWARMPGGWQKLDDSTTSILIPARPWATITFANSEFKAKVVANWHAAVKKTYQDMVQK